MKKIDVVNLRLTADVTDEMGVFLRRGEEMLVPIVPRPDGSNALILYYYPAARTIEIPEGSYLLTGSLRSVEINRYRAYLISRFPPGRRINDVAYGDILASYGARSFIASGVRRIEGSVLREVRRMIHALRRSADRVILGGDGRDAYKQGYLDALNKVNDLALSAIQRIEGANDVF